MTKSLYGALIDEQTRIRIQVAKAAYAYEVEDNPIISDSEFDELCKKVNLDINTRRPDLDKYFKEEFSSNTGAWIWNHPDFSIIGRLVTDGRRSRPH